MQGQTIKDLKTELGLEGASELIALVITNFTRVFNVSKNMNEDQIMEYAMDFVENNQLFNNQETAIKFEDICLFFEGAKSGRYGNKFDHIDGALINEFFAQYKKERHRVFKRLETKRYLEQIEIDRKNRATPEQVEQFNKECQEMFKAEEEAKNGEAIKV